MLNPKKKQLDIYKIQNYLKIDPNERKIDILNQIHDEIQELEFFANLIKQNQRDFVVNVLCKYMTCLPIKKKEIEQNRDNIQIILEGKLDAYIPPMMDSQKEEDQTPRKLKKKYIHSLHPGQCINLQTVCFKKIASFQFDCSDNLILLNIPCVVDNNISVLSQFDLQVRNEYDFIFEALIQLDSFYTQQQVRDILFVSKKHHFKKGHIQLKHSGLIIFILLGEFSIFKDFFKQNKVKDSNSVQQQNNFAELLKIKKGNDSDKDEDDEFDDDQNTEQGTKINDLQNLKMQFKKKDSQLFKRVRLGIKKPGSLVVLAKKDNSIDGIECLDSEGMAFICTEEQYEAITKEQDRRSDASQFKIPSFQSENLLQSSNQLENVKDKKQKQKTQGNSKKSLLQIPLFSEKFLSKSSLNEEIDQDNENSQDSNQESSNNDNNVSPLNKVKGKPKLDNSKGNMLRNKFELNYRQSLITNIGQQIQSFGEFFYKNKKSQKNEQLQMLSQQKQQQNEIKKTQQQGMQLYFTERQNYSNINQQQNQNVQNQQVIKIIDNVSSNPVLTEQDEEKIMKYLAPQQPKRLDHKKSQTWVSPFQRSVQNTVRGTYTSIQATIQDNTQKNSSLTNRDRSISPYTPKQSEKNVIKENKNLSNDSTFYMRSKSSLLIQRTPSFLQPQSACNTPSRKLVNGSQINGISSLIKNTFNDSIQELSQTNKNKKNSDQQLSKASTLNVPNLDLKKQANPKGEAKQYCGYNFINSNSENNTPIQINSPSSTPNDNRQGGFSDNCASLFQRSRAVKKKNANSQDNTPTNNALIPKKSLKEKLIINRSQRSSSRLKQFDNIENALSTTHRASSTHNLSENKDNVSSLVNLQQLKKDQNSQQTLQKQATTITINSLNNLPASKTMTNLSIHEQPNYNNSKSVEKRVQSARQNRVMSQQQFSDTGRQTQIGEFNIYSKQLDQNNTVGISSKQETLYNKNIMQILYPQQMKKFDKKTRLITSKQANYKELELIANNQNTTTNQKSKQEFPAEKEFQLFLQKKLRPQSATNRNKGEKQINILNKKVLNQYISSLNNQNQTMAQNQTQQQMNNNNQQLNIKNIFK